MDAGPVDRDRLVPGEVRRVSIWDAGFSERPEDEREGEDAWEDSDDLEDDHAPWRGELHFDEWPEGLAGPEWEMWKKMMDDEDDGG